MKLDPDLVRKVLIAYEELGYRGGPVIEIPGHSADEVNYHQERLAEAGFIEYLDMSGFQDTLYLPKNLTYQGHQFLEASRNDKNWEKVKAVMAKSGGFVLEFAWEMLIELGKKQLFP